MEGFDKKVDEWVKKCQQVVQHDEPSHSLSVMKGDRWWRIVQERPTGQGVYGFVDAKGDPDQGENIGDIRRADGWKRPAKLKTYLGNIYDENGGTEFVTVNGPRPRKKSRVQPISSAMGEITVRGVVERQSSTGGSRRVAGKGESQRQCTIKED